MWRHERLILELDPGADPIAGRVGPTEDSMLEFAGYVELIAALERVRTGFQAGEPGRESKPADKGDGGR